MNASILRISLAAVALVPATAVTTAAPTAQLEETLGKAGAPSEITLNIGVVPNQTLGASGNKTEEYKFPGAMEMIDLIVGKYKLESSDNFDEYMKSIGVGFVTRKLGASASPVVTVTRETDGKYRLKTETAMKTTDIAFRIGEPFDEETLDGRQVKSVMTQPTSNTLVQVQRKDDFVSTITREFTPQGHTATLVHNDVTAKRYYKRVP